MILPMASLGWLCQGIVQSSPALSARFWMQHYVWLDKKIKVKILELTWTLQYSIWSSSNSMAVCKLNPFLAPPFSGQGMIGRPVGWAVKAFHKASFSAERVTEVSMEVNEVFCLLTLQFFNLGGILHAQLFICLELHKKNKSAIKKTLTICLREIFILICSRSTSDALPSDRKNFTSNMLLDALLFVFFVFGHQYSNSFLG
jgi:hypothetical protein